MATGRPTGYNEEIAAEFCSRIALGNSLRFVTSQDDMPSHQTIYNWFNKFPPFIEQYTRAKEDSADSRVDQIEEIADKVLVGEYDPAAARVAIDAFKWTSGKHRPKKYGDKITTEHTGSIDLKGLSDEELDAKIKMLTSET
jgi:hypothetical protein